MIRNTTRADYFVVAILTLIYLLLPTQNSTLDAWYYAACVKHGHELLLPHHLLYNPACWLWVRGLALLGVEPDTLAALKVLNALAAGAGLAVLSQVIRPITGQSTWPWLLVAGSSFGVARFATENETYIVPLLFSLVGSWCWGNYVRGRRTVWALVGAGFWAALACLFHQIHVFWWLGLLVGTWRTAPVGALRWRYALIYLLPALLVPAVYAVALICQAQVLTVPALWHFVFHDYYAGTAGGGGSGKGALLTVVNLVRTFGQVHGSVAAVLRLNPVSGAAVAAVVLLLAYAIRAVVGWGRVKTVSSSSRSITTKALVQTHCLILALHLLFAAYSDGNAEFMVMIPALGAIIGSATLTTLPSTAVAATGLALLVWNLTFALVPGHQLRFVNTGKLLTRIQQEPTNWFLLENHNLILNQLHYQTGNPTAPPNVRPSPTRLVQQPGQSVGQFRQWLRRQHQAGHRVYTDGLRQPYLLDRAQVLYGNQNAELVRGRATIPLDSFPTALGMYYLTEIR